MTLSQVGGVLLIFTLCPILGALPLVQWFVYGLTRIDLRQVGTGNASVSAAFYHGGRSAGIAAVVSEAAKGIGAVLLARLFFPASSVWELVAVMALVLGRFWASRGAGVTNVVWAMVAHDPVVALLTAGLCGVGFTIVRERQTGKLLSLAMLPATLWLMHPTQLDRVAAAATISGLLYWIYQKVPDDLDLQTTDAAAGSQAVFRFFKADRSIATLDDPLDADRVGEKIARLSQLRHWGYAVPAGWVWQAGDDLELVAQAVQPSPERAVMLRSSPCGEATVPLAAREPYGWVANITDRDALALAIEECWNRYEQPDAVAYRRERDLDACGMAVLVQEQIAGVFSGRVDRVGAAPEPESSSEPTIAIEAWLGDAIARHRSRITVERYHAERPSDPLPDAIPPHTDRFLSQKRSKGAQGRALPASSQPKSADWIAAIAVTPLNSPNPQSGGELPLWLLREVAAIAWQLEARSTGVATPISFDWSYDGDRLWILG